MIAVGSVWFNPAQITYLERSDSGGTIINFAGAGDDNFVVILGIDPEGVAWIINGLTKPKDKDQ